ncbi:MAG: hypothetical protein JW839_18555 [Candidatus Lokiarchaeota archaeon]|nr:hypothetical protein [Candidatus Lokiarchaeota archaeon]
MDATLLAVLLVLEVLATLIFYLCVLVLMAWHHIRVKQGASKLLLVHGIIEAFFAVFCIFAFIESLRSLLLLFFAIDALLAAWIVFDSLYGRFFYDGADYQGVVTRPFAFFLLLWIASHFVIGYYDLSGNPDLRYVIPGMTFLGVLLIEFIFYRGLIQFKRMREHADIEVENVEKGDRWKVLLVSKQYKLLQTQFPAHALALLAFAFGLVDAVIEGLGLLATILFSAGMTLFTIGKGCQLLGFFYPVPGIGRPFEALEGG